MHACTRTLVELVAIVGVDRAVHDCGASQQQHTRMRLWSVAIVGVDRAVHDAGNWQARAVGKTNADAALRSLAGRKFAVWVGVCVCVGGGVVSG